MITLSGLSLKAAHIGARFVGVASGQKEPNCTFAPYRIRTRQKHLPSTSSNPTNAYLN